MVVRGITEDSVIFFFSADGAKPRPFTLGRGRSAVLIDFLELERKTILLPLRAAFELMLGPRNQWRLIHSAYRFASNTCCVTASGGKTQGQFQANR
jgi:hypothetical protein